MKTCIPISSTHVKRQGLSHTALALVLWGAGQRLKEHKDFLPYEASLLASLQGQRETLFQENKVRKIEPLLASEHTHVHQMHLSLPPPPTQNFLYSSCAEILS